MKTKIKTKTRAISDAYYALIIKRERKRKKAINST